MRRIDFDSLIESLTKSEYEALNNKGFAKIFRRNTPLYFDLCLSIAKLGEIGVARLRKLEESLLRARIVSEGDLDKTRSIYNRYLRDQSTFSANDFKTLIRVCYSAKRIIYERGY